MRNQLLKIMEQNNLTYQELAKRTSCSPGVLSKFLYKNETIKFDIIIDLVRELDEEEAIKHMVNYCNEISKPSDVKVALEYLAINLEYDALKTLMDKHQESENKQLKEWVSAYNFFYEYKTGHVGDSEAYEVIKSCKTKIPELSVLIKLIEINILYNMDNNKQISFIIEPLYKNINELEDGFIKNSFYGRYLQYSTHNALYSYKDPVRARNEAKKGLGFELTNAIHSFFYNIIATSYFNESITKMNHYAAVSLKLLEKTRFNYRIPEIQNRFNKLNIIMGRPDLEVFEDKEDPLDLYLEGKKEGNIFKLLESLSKFMKYGDHFLAQVVIDELNFLKCDINLVNAIQSIK